MHELKQYELTPVLDNKKSFYGKAMVSEYEDGSKVLKCYGDRTLEISGDKFYRLTESQEISKTAMRHVRDFIYQQTGQRNFGENDFAELPFKPEDNPTSIETLEVNKAELYAKGTVDIDGAKTDFSYNFYSGEFSFANPEIGSKEAAQYIKRDVLATIFPLVGKEQIGKLLSQVGENALFSNGLFKLEHIISASDVLSQINDINSRDQVLRLYSGNVAVLMPKEDHYESAFLLKTGGMTATKSFKTFSDAMKEIPKHIQEVDRNDIDRYSGNVKKRDERRNNRMIHEAFRNQGMTR